MQDKSGFTLVELLVAILIMMVGLLGLLQSVNIALEYNLKNQMRNEVVRVAQDSMNLMRSMPYDATFSPITTIPTSLRNINRTYTVKRKRETVSDNSIKYYVDVVWAYKNISTTQSVMTVRSRAE
jgi:type IV pilus assembly protein PilV